MSFSGQATHPRELGVCQEPTSPTPKLNFSGNNECDEQPPSSTEASVKANASEVSRPLEQTAFRGGLIQRPCSSEGDPKTVFRWNRPEKQKMDFIGSRKGPIGEIRPQGSQPSGASCDFLEQGPKPQQCKQILLPEVYRLIYISNVTTRSNG